MDRTQFSKWLRVAGARAKLRKLEGGLWRPYRRMWARKRESPLAQGHRRSPWLESDGDDARVLSAARRGDVPPGHERAAETARDPGAASWHRSEIARTPGRNSATNGTPPNAQRATQHGSPCQVTRLPYWGGWTRTTNFPINSRAVCQLTYTPSRPPAPLDDARRRGGDAV